MNQPPATPRRVVLVHLPKGHVIDAELWRARRGLLHTLGWRGSVGLCAPAPKHPFVGIQPSGLSGLPILRELGVSRCYNLAALRISPLDPGDQTLDATVRGLTPGPPTSIEELLRMFASRGAGLLLREHLDAILESVRGRWGEVHKDDTLFVASECSWLLLAVATRLCTHADDRATIMRLPIHDFPGVAAINANGFWGGFIELRPQVPRQWYLDQLP